MFPAGLHKGGYIIGGVKCVNCGEYKHNLIFGGYRKYPHKSNGGVMAKKKNDKKGKGKKVTKVVGLILALTLFSAPVMAAGVGWSSDYAIKDNINVISGSDDLDGSAGIFIGTLGEVKTESGKKLLGLGGMALHVGETGHLVVALDPITLFDDILQIGASIDTSNFRWKNPDDYLFSVGFSASALIGKLWR